MTKTENDGKLERLVRILQSGIFSANPSSEVGEGAIFGYQSALSAINRLYQKNYETDTGRVKRDLKPDGREVLCKQH